MGQKDLAQSDYFNDKVRFADACNGILFQGKEIIRPEELQEPDAEMVYREEEKRRKIIPDIGASVFSMKRQSYAGLVKMKSLFPSLQ